MQRALPKHDRDLIGCVLSSVGLAAAPINRKARSPKLTAHHWAWACIRPSAVPAGQWCSARPLGVGVSRMAGLERIADGAQVKKNLKSYDEAMRRIKTEFIPDQARDAMRRARVA